MTAAVNLINIYDLNGNTVSLSYQDGKLAKVLGPFDRSFNAIDYRWMMKFVEYRIADPRLLRLIRKWLRVGVSEDGQWR